MVTPLRRQPVASAIAADRLERAELLLDSSSSTRPACPAAPAVGSALGVGPVLAAGSPVGVASPVAGSSVASCEVCGWTADGAPPERPPASAGEDGRLPATHQTSAVVAHAAATLASTTGRRHPGGRNREGGGG
ncbi:hypothetical protein ACFYUV_27975 [Nonomuraea sp. NPDC003560]|uniref:hypothetical protein n=1 Tax=Nonomuraea sp. NPDC003560 TaxID=3364341 RepID=UPI0036AC2B6D